MSPREGRAPFVIVGTLLGVGLLTAGCASASRGEGPAGHGISSYTGSAEEAGDAALITGVVRNHEGCLVIAAEDDPGEFWFPLFPDQALSMVDGEVTFTPSTGAPVSLAEGQRVSLGGGGYGGVGDTIVAGDGRRSPVAPGEGCEADEYFLVHAGEGW